MLSIAVGDFGALCVTVGILIGFILGMFFASLSAKSEAKSLHLENLEEDNDNDQEEISITSKSIENLTTRLEDNYVEIVNNTYDRERYTASLLQEAKTEITRLRAAIRVNGLRAGFSQQDIDNVIFDRNETVLMEKSDE